VKKIFYTLLALIVMATFGIFTIAADVNVAEGYFLQQIAKGPTDLTSVDDSGNGIIDEADTVTTIGGLEYTGTVEWMQRKTYAGHTDTNGTPDEDCYETTRTGICTDVGKAVSVSCEDGNVLVPMILNRTTESSWSATNYKGYCMPDIE